MSDAADATLISLKPYFGDSGCRQNWELPEDARFLLSIIPKIQLEFLPEWVQDLGCIVTVK